MNSPKPPHTAASIFESIRRDVISGQLGPGVLLSPVRELAAQLGVNRNTVAAAYKKLVGAGVAETLGRNGTIIRGPTGMAEQEGVTPGSVLYDLAGGNPDPALLPDPLIALQESGYRPTLYGEPVMNRQLEEQGRAWMAPDVREQFSLTLTHGAVDAIERLLAAYLVPGDKVAVEDPCFLGSLNILRCAALEAIPVVMDESGMQPDSLREALQAGAQAVICTPRAQNPTGCNLSRQRADQLRRVLADFPHVLVIEDDHFGLLAAAPYFTITPVTASRWALIRSLSKGLGPDMRMAFVASDAGTAERLQLRLRSGTTWVSHLLQSAAQILLGSAATGAAIRQAGTVYAARREALSGALNRRGIRVMQPCDGLNVWIELPDEADASRVALAMAHHGWQVRTGEAFFIVRPVPALRITTSTLEPADAERFAANLGDCLAGGTSR